MKEFDYIKMYIADKKSEHNKNYLQKNADNKRVMRKLVEKDGTMLYYASPRLQGDKEVVIAAIESNPDAYFYALPQLRMDEDVAEAFVKNGRMRDTIIVLKVFAENKPLVKKCINHYVEQNIDMVDKILFYCDKKMQNDSEILACIPPQFQGKALRGCFAKTDKGDWLERFLYCKTNLNNVDEKFFEDSVFCTAVEYTGMDRMMREFKEKNISLGDEEDFMSTLNKQLHEIVTQRHEIASKNANNLDAKKVKNSFEMMFGAE
ncbi:MAG: DUF4116 domain-containing protein [Clostridia bacterium]|nr:DUF4116 domain-containing protein [Clostridia bacterium]